MIKTSFDLGISNYYFKKNIVTVHVMFFLFCTLEIHADYRTVVCPTVDFIDHDDFHYRGVDPYIRGTFNWRFDYKEKVISTEEKMRRRDPTEGVK